MKVYNVKLRELLEGAKQFVVPRFQRTYSWRKKHWEELWNDLDELYQSANSREHFMGAIVTMPIEMQPHGIAKFLLIDGQQRLTTILLILACLRDMLEAGEIFAEEIKNSYLVNQYKQQTNRYKLLPTKIDDESFFQIIDGQESSNSEIMKAYKYFNRQMKSDLNLNENKGDIEKMLTTIIEKLVFASIVIDSDDNPYRIFHSLNGTGEDLTQVDLIRNHIFMNIPEDDQDTAYEDYWLPMQQELNEQDPKAFDKFMLDFILKDGEFVSKNAAFDTIRHAADKQVDTSKYVIDLLQDLSIYFRYYLRLVAPSKEKNRNLSSLIDRLNSLRITTPYPFLLNLYRDMDNGKITVEQFCHILEVIESYLVRRYFCRIHSRGLTHIFINMYKAVSREKDIVVATHNYLRARKFPTDEEFLSGWVTYPVYGTGIQDRSKFVLSSLENAIKRNNEPVDIDSDRITREHIMPVTLSDNWREMIGDQYESVHNTYVNTIGNLTLTGENELMGNRSFDYKRSVFARSSFAINKYFHQCQKWDQVEIEKRARCLGKIALQIWKRPQI